MNIVIVESPAKAKTINKYLGRDYTVLASYGHVRDLPSKDGSVRPDTDFAMNWEVDAKARKHIKKIAAAVKGADRLYLATDPDREGEAISWHVCEVLGGDKVLKGVEVKRVVFNEITKSAILEAFAHPRDLDWGLVDAYLARRALDYLVGFTLSPMLWRKLPGSRSAGRVQSVALRLICEREIEIEVFQSREYWTVDAEFICKDKPFSARLTHLGGDKLEKMTLADAKAAKAATDTVKGAAFSIAHVERKKSRRNPAAPFTTSTLQQEASRKLHFGAHHTMRIAQELYEGVNAGDDSAGLITYMRTDGVQMAGEAITACRRLIGEDWGDAYLPKSPRIYKSKAKNAQEAHEAIRPTDVSRRPETVTRYLNKDQQRLYELIWKRTIASQMQPAVLDQVAADISSPDKKVILRATGSVVAFDGFYKLYREGRDDGGGEDAERILPELQVGETPRLQGVKPDQHFTQPPPRFSEASLVKHLEKLGIGRPSTYASILSVLQDRDYVRLHKRQFVPEDRGRLVTAFLSSFFSRYVEYNFTAELEDKLDEISGGRLDWKVVLREFWSAFSKAIDETKERSIREVLDALDEILVPHFFRDDGSGTDLRACPDCGDGRLNLKLGKYGAFIGCSNYPGCRFTKPLTVAHDKDGEAAAAGNGPRLLGTDPETRLEVSLRQGPYGFYVQLGATQEKGGTRPKRASLPKDMDPETLDLERALALLSLPREIGRHPESGETITAGIGRYGPYIKHGGVYLSLKDGDDVLGIGLNRAVALIADAPKKKPPKLIGEHPANGKPVTLHSGRFGPYVQHGSLRATLPKGVDKDAMDLDEALAVLAAKAAKGKTPAKKRPARKKPTASTSV
ncbi:MAG TPA: type I DNA topoisomerase [Rhodospirillales bacterium]|jgi:DNA topoisomerase-1|nr:type I DNA topoisomerase [Rhodospirillales bacterium]